MKVTEISASIVDLLISSEQSAPRSEGIHVSSVIRYIKECFSKREGWPEEELSNAGQMGRVWEKIVAEQLAVAGMGGEYVVRPGEIEFEGVVGNPDGIDTESVEIIEYKCSWQSSKHAPEIKRPDWFWQIKAYCHMTGITRARLYVLYVNGDYKPPMPVVRAWRYEFTTGELRSNWSMLKNNAIEMVKANAGQ